MDDGEVKTFPPWSPLIPDYGQLEGHYPAYSISSLLSSENPLAKL